MSRLRAQWHQFHETLVTYDNFEWLPFCHHRSRLLADPVFDWALSLKEEYKLIQFSQDHEFLRKYIAASTNRGLCVTRVGDK
jgi:hypothetical protein